MDNDTAERALKMILRYRKNSLFYENAHGAYVGDVLISLIETCRLVGAKPLEYLSALMENRSAVFADPAAWLPWAYRDHLGSAKAILPLSHPPPVLGQFDRLGVAVAQGQCPGARPTAWCWRNRRRRRSPTRSGPSPRCWRCWN